MFLQKDAEVKRLMETIKIQDEMLARVSARIYELHCNYLKMESLKALAENKLEDTLESHKLEVKKLSNRSNNEERMRIYYVDMVCRLTNKLKSLEENKEQES